MFKVCSRLYHATEGVSRQSTPDLMLSTIYKQQHSTTAKQEKLGLNHLYFPCCKDNQSKQSSCANHTHYHKLLVICKADALASYTGTNMDILQLSNAPSRQWSSLTYQNTANILQQRRKAKLPEEQHMEYSWKMSSPLPTMVEWNTCLEFGN